jgi:hypothetical protein
MTPKQTIRALLATAGEPARRIARRQAWAMKTWAAWSRAQREMDDKCTEAVEHLTEEEFDRLFDQEEAKVDALRTLLDDVIERDKWPREMHFGCI